MPPEFTRPECPLTLLGEPGKPISQWTGMAAVTKTLRRHGMSQQASEFARRASELPVDEDDTTEFLALVVEYVEII